MALQRRIFGSWDLLSAELTVNQRNPYDCRWHLAVLWTPYRWAQWISGPAVRTANVFCWAGGDHLGEFLWDADGSPISPTLATALRVALWTRLARQEATRTNG